MWVNRKEWKKLKEEVFAISVRQEQILETLSRRTKITVYQEPQMIFGKPAFPDSKDIDISDVIERILSHIGLKLCYKSAKAAAVEVCKIEKKKVKA